MAAMPPVFARPRHRWRVSGIDDDLFVPFLPPVFHWPEYRLSCTFHLDNPLVYVFLMIAVCWSAFGRTCRPPSSQSLPQKFMVSGHCPREFDRRLPPSDRLSDRAKSAPSIPGVFCLSTPARRRGLCMGMRSFRRHSRKPEFSLRSPLLSVTQQWRFCPTASAPTAASALQRCAAGQLRTWGRSTAHRDWGSGRWAGPCAHRVCRSVSWPRKLLPD